MSRLQFSLGLAGLSDSVNPETDRVRGLGPHRFRDAFFGTHAMKLDNSGDALRLLQRQLGRVRGSSTGKAAKQAFVA